MTDPAELLAEAEEEIETWLVELDVTWSRLLAEAEAVLAGARADAARLVALAETRARDIVHRAEAASRSMLAESEAEVLRARELAVESNATARVLALAADAAVTGRVRVDDLAALGDAVVRLRAELSRVVDAAFDALPAVEATAAALNLGAPADPTEPALRPARKRSIVRRLMRI